MPGCLFPDNSVVINFATADRLDLLQTALRGRGRVVEAVWREIELSSGRVPNLNQLDLVDWFGEPIRIEVPSDVQAIESVRLGAFGAARSDPATLHLGESQTLHVIGAWPDFAGSIWITEDKASYDYARKRGIIGRHTFDILQELVAFGDIDADQAFSVADAILEAGRPMLREPDSPRDFQP